MVEEAFRLNVKSSLHELSRAINGDGKSGPNPLFKVKVVLENDKVGCIKTGILSTLHTRLNHYKFTKESLENFKIIFVCIKFCE